MACLRRGGKNDGSTESLAFNASKRKSIIQVIMNVFMFAVFLFIYLIWIRRKPSGEGELKKKKTQCVWVNIVINLY